MLDLLGNKLSEGDLLYWLKHDLVCHVAKVDEPVLSLAGKSESRQMPHLTIQITFPVPMDKGEIRAMVSGFVKVVNPKSQEIMERITGASRPQ